MKNSLLIFFTIATVALASACKGPQKTAEAAPEPKSEAKSEVPAQPAPPASDAPAADKAQKSTERPAKLGSAIVEETITGLNKRLVTDQATSDKIGGIIKNGFNAVGGDYSKMYPAEEAKALKSKMIKHSESEILGVLDEKQKVTFAQFVQKMADR